MMRAWLLGVACLSSVAACLYPAYHVADDGGGAGTAGPGTAGAGAGTAGAGGSPGRGGATTGTAGAGGVAGTGAGGTSGGGASGAGGLGAGGAGGSVAGTSGRGGSAGGIGGTAGGGAGRGGSTAGTGGGSAGRGGSAGAGVGGTGGGGTTGAGGTAGAGGAVTIDSWTFDVSGDADFRAVALSAPDGSTTWVNDGDPAPGCVEIFGNLSSAYTQALLGISYSADLRGVILSAYIKVVTGFSPTYPGHAFAYAKSGSNIILAAGVVATVSAGPWLKLTLSMDQPDYSDTGFDASQIVEFGVIIEAPAGHETAVTARVDTITLTRSSP